MIISFKNYLNESESDDWTVVNNKSQNPKNQKSSSTPKQHVSDTKKSNNQTKSSENENSPQNIETSTPPSTKKHMVPYDNNVDQNEMEYIKKHNPELYAALTSWN